MKPVFAFVTLTLLACSIGAAPNRCPLGPQDDSPDISGDWSSTDGDYKISRISGDWFRLENDGYWSAVGSLNGNTLTILYDFMDPWRCARYFGKFEVREDELVGWWAVTDWQRRPDGEPVSKARLVFKRRCVQP